MQTNVSFDVCLVSRGRKLLRDVIVQLIATGSPVRPDVGVCEGVNTTMRIPLCDHADLTADVAELAFLETQGLYFSSCGAGGAQSHLASAS